MMVITAPSLNLFSSIYSLHIENCGPTVSRHLSFEELAYLRQKHKSLNLFFQHFSVCFSPSQTDRQDSSNGASPSKMCVCVFNGCVHVHVCECLCQHVCNFGQDVEGVSEDGGVEWLGLKER